MAEKLLLPCRFAALTCGVDSKTWRDWHQRGLVPPPVRIGGSIFWRAAELAKWAEEGRPKRDDWIKRQKLSRNPADDGFPSPDFHGSL